MDLMAATTSGWMSIWTCKRSVSTMPAIVRESPASFSAPPRAGNGLGKHRQTSQAQARGAQQFRKLQNHMLAVFRQQSIQRAFQAGGVGSFHVTAQKQNGNVVTLFLFMSNEIMGIRFIRTL
jgi:hypothetical protein